jgi:predicted dehydrogenase
MRPLKLAVIGAGHLGRIHARIAASLPSLELVAIVDPVESARREVAQAHSARACMHYGEVLGRVDAAIVATPTQRHHEISMQLLRHGIHLLVEKPLAATTAQCDELIDTARQNGALLQVGHVERFNPAFVHLQAHCGDPKYVEACRTSAFKFRSTDIGAVLDLMIHDIDLLLTLVRSPLCRVDALGIALFDECEDVANARLSFENGCIATLSASRASYQATRRLHVWSDRGFASVDLATRSGTLVRPNAEILERRFALAQLPPQRLERLKEHLFEDLLPIEHFQAPACDQITAELEDFADSIRQGRRPRVTGEQGRDALAVAERILREIENHLWDGDRQGRIGPRALPQPSLLRGPHWNALAERHTRLREAG